jgi:hypothetical protein
LILVPFSSTFAITLYFLSSKKNVYVNGKIEGAKFGYGEVAWKIKA